MSIWFHYYTSHVDSYKPIGIISLEDFVDTIRNPHPDVLEAFELIAQAAAAGDMETKDRLKQERLYYFTPCVYTDGRGRRYTNIIQFNGLAILDFDKIDNAPEFKKFVFDNFKFVICAYLSPSRRGVKFFVNIPVVSTTDEFKEYFYGLGSIFEMYKGWDGTAQNCVLPLFLSHDSEILYRDDAALWTNKGKVLNAFVESSAPVVRVETDDEKKARIYSNTRKAFAGIADNGHPQVRAAGVALGGYVASGYITVIEAQALIEECIRTTPYLQKGIPGYLTTARTAIETGQKSQLILN